MKFVEVFRTNVQTKRDGDKILSILAGLLPGHRLTFDLEDRERIFRAASNFKEIDRHFIIYIFKKEDFHCEVLQED